MRNVLTWGSRPRVKSRGKHSRKAAGTTHGTHGTNVDNSVHLLCMFVTDYFVVKRCFWHTVNAK